MPSKDDTVATYRIVATDEVNVGLFHGARCGILILISKLCAKHKFMVFNLVLHNDYLSAATI